MAKDSGRHREIRLLVKERLQERFRVVKSSHEGGDLALYCLSRGRKRGDSTQVKRPDVIAYGEDIFLIVEVELDNNPATILGDVAAIDCATHYAQSSYEETNPLPLCTVVIVVDSGKLEERSSKREQFDMIQEVYRPFGVVKKFQVCTEESFDECIKGILTGRL